MAIKTKITKAKVKKIENTKKPIVYLLPDTSTLIEGLISKQLLNKELLIQEGIIIAEESLAELEAQANTGQEKGLLGLEEIKELKAICDDKGLTLDFRGQKPTFDIIKNAHLGFIDNAIRSLAEDGDITLYTGDRVQAKVAEAKGIPVLVHGHLTPKLTMEKFFDETTMSIHLKENCTPKAKKGMPGNWGFEELRKTKLTTDEVRQYAKEIIEVANIRDDSFLELERPGSTVAQIGSYRIVITKPSFSDGYEITAVRPVKHLSIEDYHLSEKMQKRLSEKAEGMLIAGAPGNGKSTFAQALAEHFLTQDKIIKTVEAPRDLVLPDEVTQYSMNHGTQEEIHDILLLSRPDYTIYDEMRNTSDFQLFADMRLSGVGMIGVIHATKTIDAIQRFIGRIELGVIPHIVDTVIFIQNGQIGKVYAIQMTVKVPSGMTESDLARPVVEVHDFESGLLEFEIYTYGEQTVVIPVDPHDVTKKKGIHKLAEKQVREHFLKYSRNVEVEMVSDNKAKVYVNDSSKAAVIGRNGENINAIEKELGLSIDVMPISKKAVKNEERDFGNSKEIAKFGIKETKRALVFNLTNKYANKDVHFYDGEEFLMSVRVSKKAQAKLSKGNPVVRLIEKALDNGTLRIKG